MNKTTDLQNVRIITVSGRIGAGATTLAKSLSKKLGWKHIEGGEIFWEAVRKRMNLGSRETHLRPDEEDKLFDQQLRKILKEDEKVILETKLAAFNAEGLEGVFKILVVCEDANGRDQTVLRIDRIVNREEVSVEEAKKEVIEREKNDLEKWRKLYAAGDQNWTYLDRKYYDLVINTFNHGKEEALEITLDAIGYKI